MIGARAQLLRAIDLATPLFFCCVLFTLCVSCGPRVEYRARPGFTTAEDLPDEVTLSDGTIIRYVPLTEFLARKRARQQGNAYEAPSTSESESSDPARPSFLPWEEIDEETVRMQAMMPEQVVANTMRAFRDERYAALWEQMVAEGVRTRAARESGPDAAREQFVAWCGGARDDAMKLLNRISFGLSTNAVIMRKTGPTSLQIELTPQISSDFRFKIVEIEFDGKRVLLSGIR